MLRDYGLCHLPVSHPACPAKGDPDGRRLETCARQHCTQETAAAPCHHTCRHTSTLEIQPPRGQETTRPITRQRSSAANLYIRLIQLDKCFILYFYYRVLCWNRGFGAPYYYFVTDSGSLSGPKTGVMPKESNFLQFKDCITLKLM